MQVKGLAENVGQCLTRKIVRCGTESAGHDHEIGRPGRLADGVGNGRLVVGHGLVINRHHTAGCEPCAKPRRIRIHGLPEHQLIAHRKNNRIHE